MTLTALLLVAALILAILGYWTVAIVLLCAALLLGVL